MKGSLGVTVKITYPDRRRCFNFSFLHQAIPNTRTVDFINH